MMKIFLILHLTGYEENLILQLQRREKLVMIRIVVPLTHRR